MAETKPMSMKPTVNREHEIVYDLEIERDSGNPVRILMAKKTVAMNKADWQKLHELCETVLHEIEVG